MAGDVIGVVIASDGFAVVVRADDVFDIDDRAARRRPAIRSRLQVDGHVRVYIAGEVEGVGARAAVDRVVIAVSENDGVVACAATEQEVVVRIVVVRSIGVYERVVAGPADDALDVDERIDIGRGDGHVHRGRRVDGDRDPLGRVADVGIIGDVDFGAGTAAAVQRVVAEPTDERVVAGAAGQEVGVAVARDGIGEGGAGDVLDVDDLVLIAGREAGDSHHRGSAERHGDAVDAIRRAAALHVGIIGRVAARAAVERVVAESAGEHVGIRIAGDRVGEGRADDVLEIDDFVLIAGGEIVYGHLGRAVKRDRDAGHAILGVPDRHVGIIRRVDARAAIEIIAAKAALDYVGVRIARDRVAEPRADDVLEIDDRVDVASLHRRRRGDGPVEREVHAKILRGVGVIDRIGAGAAVERIVAVTARNRVVGGVAEDRVRLVRADDVLEIDDRVDVGRRHRNGGQGAAVQRQVDGGRRIAVIDRIGAAAAVERIVAGTAAQDIVAGVAEQGVGAAATDDVLEIHDRVDVSARLHGDGNGGRAVQREREGSRGVRIIDRIAAGAAVERVVAEPAADQIGVAVARDGVREGRADDVFEIDDRVDIAAHDDRRRRRHRPGERQSHAGSGIGIIERVDAGPAVERIVAAAARDGVVAGLRVDVIGVVIAGDTIRVGVRADDVFDIDDRAARSRAAIRVRQQVDVKVRIAVGGEIGRVGTGTAVERIVQAVSENEGVVAGAAVEQEVVDRIIVIPPRAIPERVVAGAADDALDVDERIDIRAGGDGQQDRTRRVDPDRQRLGRVGHIGIIGDVDFGAGTAAAVQRVVAEPTDERVVAGAAVEEVGVAVARDGIGEGGTDDVLDVDELVLIARREAGDTRGGGAVERDGDAVDAVRRAGRGYIGIIRRVGARAAIQRVVAATAREQVGVRVAGERVGILRADDVAEAADGVVVARAEAGDGRRDIAVERHGHAEAAAGVGIVDRVAGLATAVHRVVAGAAGYRVDAETAEQRVVARAAAEEIGVRIAGDRIRVGRAGDVLDVDDGIDVGAAEPAGRRIGRAAQREREARAAARIAVVERVGARAAVDRVVAEATDNGVVARAGVDRVVAPGAVDQIGVRVA